MFKQPLYDLGLHKVTVHNDLISTYQVGGQPPDYNGPFL